MKYFKNIENGYIVSISQIRGYTEITTEEYNTILDIIKNKPQAEQGYDYRLKEDLSWELVEVPIEIEEEVKDNG